MVSDKILTTKQELLCEGVCESIFRSGSNLIFRHIATHSPKLPRGCEYIFIWPWPNSSTTWTPCCKSYLPRATAQNHWHSNTSSHQNVFKHHQRGKTLRRVLFNWAIPSLFSSNSPESQCYGTFKKMPNFPPRAAVLSRLRGKVSAILPHKWLHTPHGLTSYRSRTEQASGDPFIPGECARTHKCMHTCTNTRTYANICTYLHTSVLNKKSDQSVWYYQFCNTMFSQDDLFQNLSLTNIPTTMTQRVLWWAYGKCVEYHWYDEECV